jgi:hypothetical protein
MSALRPLPGVERTSSACGPTYSYDSNARLKLEAKDHMRARREVA